MKTINIFGKLVSKLKNGYAVAADQVYDETLGKTQSEINQESGDTGVDNKIAALVEKLPSESRGCVTSASWDSYPYEGERLVPPNRLRMRVGTYADATGGQGMAIYGDKLFRLKNGGTASVFKFVDGGFESLGNITFNGSNSTWHCNSAQFAPTVESGQTYPLLYIAGLTDGKCYVERITDNNGVFSTTLVQTITITSNAIVPSIGINVQIGDDGHIWAAYISSSLGVVAIKYRKVLVSEGNVTLTESDIIDYAYNSVDYTYSNKPWQGCKIYNNKLWFFYGSASRMGFYVADLVTKKVINDVEMTGMVTNGEFEDGDFKDGILYIGYWPSGTIVKVGFE